MKTVALRRLAELNPATPEFDDIPPDSHVTFFPLEAVWSDSRADHDRVAVKADVSNGYTRFRAGDVVCPKVTPTFQAGRAMVARTVGAGTTELHILRPRVGTDPRWVGYAVRSKHFLDEGVTAFQGVAGLQRVPPDFVNNFQVADYPPDEQRRIADFLDDRVGRIDRIITARRRHESYANEVFESWWSRSLDRVREAYGYAPLRRTLESIVDGPFGSSLASQHYADSGTRVIRLGNIGIADFRNEDHAYITDEYGAELANHSVEAGDIVMAGLGDETWPLGRCAVVPDIGKAIVKADCYRIRLRPGMSHAFATIALSSPRVRSHLAVLSRGATRARLNTDIARDAPLVAAPRDAQEQYVSEWSARRSHTTKVLDMLSSEIDLLAEYKSSLITAAVSGELDVTTAGSGIPG